MNEQLREGIKRSVEANFEELKAIKKYLYDRIRPREWLLQAGATFYLF